MNFCFAKFAFNLSARFRLCQTAVLNSNSKRRESITLEPGKIWNGSLLFWTYFNSLSPKWSTIPITAMGRRQCLPLSIIIQKLKGKHCWKTHCRNWIVVHCGLCFLKWCLIFADPRVNQSKSNQKNVLYYYSFVKIYSLLIFSLQDFITRVKLHRKLITRCTLWMLH